MTPVARAPHQLESAVHIAGPPTLIRKGALLAKSLRFHAMLSKQAVERLPIYSRSFRSSGDVARVAIELASQVRRFEQTDILNLCRTEAEFARLDTGGALSRHVR